MNSAHYPDTTKLLFYKSFQNQPVIRKLQSLMDECRQLDHPDLTKKINTRIYFDLKSQVLSSALSHTEKKFYGDTPWKNYIMQQIIADENPMNLLMEKTFIPETHPFYHCFCKEIQIISQIYDFDWPAFFRLTGADDDFMLCTPVFTPNPSFSDVNAALIRREDQSALMALNTYIQSNGLSILGQSRCFKIESAAKDLIPISGRLYKKMDDLIGYGQQKKTLIDNTAAFIKKYHGLNVLLRGDMGTGKSTMVKALLNTFADTKLRMIEVKRSQLSLLPEIIGRIAGRPYPFIIFIDDLSFDENDEDFKLFKNSLEGSLEDNPKNIRIYATSNKRHLITETRSERDDAIHAGDIMQEKLSLTARFGLVLNFSTPNQKDYLDIVFYLAASKGLKIADEELKNKALQWEKRHLNRSGRTAEQFIENLLTQVSPQ